MPNWNRTLDQSRFRRIVFREGKVLQSREMNLLQDLERYIPGLTSARLAKYDLDAIFMPGALLNARVEVIGQTSVRISREIPDLPVLVFVAGSFEPIETVQQFSFTPKGDGSVDRIYANWVLWKVSADPNDPDALFDATLRDTQSGEPAANVGQIEVWLSTQNEAGPVDSRMYARNQEPVVCVNLVWQGGSLQVASVSRFLGTMQATPAAPGMVRLSTGGTDVAVAGTDPRLSDARRPLPGSVHTDSIEPVQQASAPSQISYIDETGGQSYDTVYTVVSGGVSSDRLVFSGWMATLTDTLNRILGRISRLFDAVRSLGSRVSQLENRPQVDLGSHAVMPLGVPNSHPPRSSIPFEAMTDGSPNSRAFVVLQGQTALSAIRGDGDFQLLGPGFSDLLTMVNNQSLDLRQLSTLARVVKTLAMGQGGGPSVSVLSGDVEGQASATRVVRISGIPVSLPETPPPAARMLVLLPSNQIATADVPTAQGGVASLSGDVTGPTNATTVARLQGRPVSAQAPLENQVLAWKNGQWTPAAFSATPSVLSFPAQVVKANGTAYTPFWTGIQLGNVQLLYLAGDFQHGDQILPPRNNPDDPYSPVGWGWNRHTIAFSVVADNGTQLIRQATLTGGTGTTPYTVQINVWNSSSPEGDRGAHWVSVSIFCVKQV